MPRQRSALTGDSPLDLIQRPGKKRKQVLFHLGGSPFLCPTSCTLRNLAWTRYSFKPRLCHVFDGIITIALQPVNEFH